MPGEAPPVRPAQRLKAPLSQISIGQPLSRRRAELSPSRDTSDATLNRHKGDDAEESGCRQIEGKRCADGT